MEGTKLNQAKFDRSKADIELENDSIEFKQNISPDSTPEGVDSLFNFYFRTGLKPSLKYASQHTFQFSVNNRDIPLQEQ